MNYPAYPVDIGYGSKLFTFYIKQAHANKQTIYSEIVFIRKVTILNGLSRLISLLVN